MRYISLDQLAEAVKVDFAAIPAAEGFVEGFIALGSLAGRGIRFAKHEAATTASEGIVAGIAEYDIGARAGGEEGQRQESKASGGKELHGN